MPVVDLAAARWRKSSRSSNAGSNDACVEIARVDPAVAVRDSKTPDSGVLILPGHAWTGLAARLTRTG